MMSRCDYSVWGILKKCIGMRSSYKRFRLHVLNKLISMNRSFFGGSFAAFTQELSKITMPIMFNEPLSFLQRMSEYMEHTHLIHKACILSTP
ncbi:unnamed protein product, partial [Coregonus sp. 'balchen']